MWKRKSSTKSGNCPNIRNTSVHRLIVGCGYLGQRVACRWRDSGDTVHVLTRSVEHAQRFQKQDFVAITGDVLDSHSLENLPEVDTVFWAVGWDRTSGASMHEVYVTGLKNVLQQMMARCRRFIAISSTSVYGQRNGEWVDEQSPCTPAQANGQTCLAAERLLQRQSEFDKNEPAITTNILRLSGIYGPGRLLSRVSALKSGEPLAGNPDAWLNLIHVDDAADAVIRCELAEEIPNTLLVSDDEPLRRRDYYSLLANLVGAAPPRFSEDQIPVSDEPRELNKRCRNSLAKLALGWTPRFATIRDGLPHAVQTAD
ncbi:MAG: Saccharopine dehydrogenase [Planctomycetaceae bacterium]|nr:Saccharopine dehydrogenase [Planctomycetaceae bacterium]